MPTNLSRSFSPVLEHQTFVNNDPTESTTASPSTIQILTAQILDLLNNAILCFSSQLCNYKTSCTTEIRFDFTTCANEIPAPCHLDVKDQTHQNHRDSDQSHGELAKKMDTPNQPTMKKMPTVRRWMTKISAQYAICFFTTQ